jgi:hypothetical protein
MEISIGEELRVAMMLRMMCEVLLRAIASTWARAAKATSDQPHQKNTDIHQKPD